VKENCNESHSYQLREVIVADIEPLQVHQAAHALRQRHHVVLPQLERSQGWQSSKVSRQIFYVRIVYVELAQANDMCYSVRETLERIDTDIYRAKTLAFLYAVW